MSIAIGIAGGLALVLFAASLWIRRRRRRQNPFSTRSGSLVRPSARIAIPHASEVLVYIEEDGSARELTQADKKYVDTAFSPLDGARPYIKSHYSQRTPTGEIRGYLARTEVPKDMPIDPAPPEPAPERKTPQAVADSISELIRTHRRN